MTSCPILKVRGVRFRMFNGVLRTIIDDGQILMLHRNLLLVGALSRFGTRIVVDGVKFSVSNSSFVVMKDSEFTILCFSKRRF